MSFIGRRPVSETDKHRRIISHNEMMSQFDFLPEKLRSQLMPFQREGILFGIKKNGKCLIGDEMGLGKTLQALALGYYYRREWPMLIIVPSSLRYSWIDEVEKWFPEIEPHQINLIETSADICDISSGLITIVSYGLLRHPTAELVREALYNQNFRVVIADESHYIKSRKAAGTKYIVPLLQRAERKILLTGTPALNCPEELFPQLEAINPGMFGNWSEFAKRYCDAKFKFFGRQRRWTTNGASNLEELQSMLVDSVFIRRLKRDVLPQLPKKQRQKIAFKLRDSDLKKEVDSLLEELECGLERNKRSIGDVLAGGGGGAGGVGDEVGGGSLEIFKVLTSLYTSTCLAKLGPVKDYVKFLSENKELKFIVFAHHRVMMNGISEQLHDSHVKFIRIDGSTVPQDRPRLVAQFQTDAETRVAVLSMKAAGVGLTLTAASVVVFAELDWTPGTMSQCEDRAHRIGQRGVVHVHYLVASGTLDDFIWGALSRKTTVVAMTLNGEKQVLRMKRGNTEQTECLDNAQAYVPSDDTNADLAAILHTPRPAGQKTVLEFFSSSNPNNSKITSNNSLSQDVRTNHCNSSPRVATSTDSFQLLSPVISSPKTEIRTRSESCIEKIPTSGNKETTEAIRIDSDSSSDNDLVMPCSSRGKIANTSSGRGGTSRGKTRRQRKSTGRFPSTKLLTDGTAASKKCNSSTVKISSMLDSVSQRQTENTADELPDIVDVSANDNNSSRKLQYSDESASPYFSRTNVSSDSPTFAVSPSAKRKRTEEDDYDFSMSKTWSCSACTFINNPAARACKICTTKRRPNSTIAEYLCKEDDANRAICDRANDVSSDLDKTLEFEEEMTVDLSADCVKTSMNLSGDKVDEFEYDGMFLSDIEEDVSLTAKELAEVSSGSPSRRSPQDVDSEVELSFAAAILSSPSSSPPSSNSRWSCVHCGVMNYVDCNGEECDGCFRPRSEQTTSKEDKLSSVLVDGADEVNVVSCDSLEGAAGDDDDPVIDLDNMPVHESFQFCCSLNTTRIYLYDSAGVAIGVNFSPLDVELKNYSELPSLLHHPQHLQLIKYFVRSWKSLSATKRRVVIRCGQLFVDPVIAYQQIRSGVVPSKQRYITKAVVDQRSLDKAKESGGTVRVICRSAKNHIVSATQTKPLKDFFNAAPNTKGKISRSGAVKDIVSATQATDPSKDLMSGEDLNGFIQAVDSSGAPLCLNCHAPYQSDLLSRKILEKNSWQTRLCSRKCLQQFWMRRHQSYSVRQVYEEEHGICQLCQFNAHDFFKLIKDTGSVEKRAKMIQESKYASLSADVKEKMARQPFQGQFWNVDHELAVAEGGGECDVDNLRTLCTLCHREVTRQQNKDRARTRLKEAAASCMNIRTFFKPT